MENENKWYFTSKQAREIKHLLDDRKNTHNKDEVKRIAQRLRNRGFYLSEFGLNFSSENFNQEVELGNIIIDDDTASPQTTDKAILMQNEASILIRNNHAIKNSNTEGYGKGCTALIIVIILISTIISIFNDDKSEHQPKVIKTERYNSSYDQQINDLKKDMQKSADWVESIVIYDDNCDTIATVYK